jgi:hypothetical protein
MTKQQNKFLQKEDISFPNTFKNRFYSKILMPQNEDGCMLWLGSKCKDGYGFINQGSKVYSAHRFLFVLYHGKIERNKIICHRCDNPSCVRPDHLFMATQSENMIDRQKKGRTSRGLNRPNVKLNDVKVLEIRADNHSTYRELSEKYNVAPCTIAAVKNRKIWRHL